MEDEQEIQLPNIKPRKDTPLKRGTPHWRQTPEWLETVDKVKKFQERGYGWEEIVQFTKFKDHVVKRIMEDETIAAELAWENYKKKIPTIKEIVGLGLSQLRDTMKEIAADPELRRQLLSTAKDIGTFAKVVTDLNTLLRLELGESTQNVSSISRNFQETRVVLQELKKKDPIFDYPELAEPVKEEPNGEQES